VVVIRRLGSGTVDWVAIVVSDRVQFLVARRRGVLTCHWRRSRLVLPLVAELHRLQAALRICVWHSGDDMRVNGP
jgi:hypothetical protein